MGNGFFVVFDLTNEDSLNAIKDWIEEIKEKCQDPEPKLIILGNKEDLKKNRIDKDIIEKQLENYTLIEYLLSNSFAEIISFIVSDFLNFSLKIFSLFSFKFSKNLWIWIK